MITLHLFVQRHRTNLLLGAGLASMALSVLMMYALTLQIRDVKDVALPAAVALTPLEKRLAVLKEQTQLTELQAELGNSAQDEKVRMYVFPPHDEIDRLLQTFDLFLNRWQTQKSVTHVTPLAVGTATGITLEGSAEPLVATTVSFEADVTAQGLADLLLFVDIAGHLTVNDAFSEDARHALLIMTEEENPAAVTALEQFLSTDLLGYVRDPGATENRLLKAFSSSDFADEFRRLIETSKLPQIERLFTKEMLVSMDEAKLWPVRMLRIKNIAIAPVTETQSHVSIMLEAIARAK